jgi:hypothetical protein
MTTRKPSSLPDITDDDFRRRLHPLARAVVPGAATTQSSAAAAEPISHGPARPSERTTALGRDSDGGKGRESLVGTPDNRSSDYVTNHFDIAKRDAPKADTRPSPLAERLAAVTHVEEVRAARGPKKGVEFLLPERVVSALKIAAAQDGTSMTVKVLEALRTAGYPITDSDFIDLRKLPKR